MSVGGEMSVGGAMSVGAWVLASGVALPRGTALVGRLPSGLDPSPDEARRWVVAELAKDDYQDRRSLLQRLFQWLGDRLSDLQSSPGSGPVSLPSFVIAGVAVALLLLLGYFATRIRRERRTVTTRSSVLDGSDLTADQLRARAATAMTENRWHEAVLDYTRAIARDADSRTLLTDAPSLTAHEIGSQLAVVFPDHVGAVSRSMDLFDAVAYGDLTASSADALTVQDTDELLRRARPRLPEQPRPPSDPRAPGPSDPSLPSGSGSPESVDESPSLWTTGVGS